MGTAWGQGVLQDFVLRGSDASAFWRGVRQRDGSRRWCEGAGGVSLSCLAVIGH